MTRSTSSECAIERWTRERGKPGTRASSAYRCPSSSRCFRCWRKGDQGAPVIDVTPLFTTEVGRGFALEFRRRFRMQDVDGARSYIQRVKSFPQNLEISFYQTWVPDMKELYKTSREGEEPLPASMGFVFHTSLLLLPETPMPGRCADDRVGFFATPFDEYGTSEHGRVQRAFINRYRLEKQDPALRSPSPCAGRVLSEPRSSGPVAALHQTGHRSVEWRVRAGRLSRRARCAGRTKRTGRSELGPGGCALFRDPLDAQRTAIRVGAQCGRSAQRRDHLLPCPCSGTTCSRW